MEVNEICVIESIIKLWKKMLVLYIMFIIKFCKLFFKCIILIYKFLVVYILCDVIGDKKLWINFLVFEN